MDRSSSCILHLASCMARVQNTVVSRVSACVSCWLCWRVLSLLVLVLVRIEYYTTSSTSRTPHERNGQGLWGNEAPNDFMQPIYWGSYWKQLSLLDCGIDRLRQARCLLMVHGSWCVICLFSRAKQSFVWSVMRASIARGLRIWAELISQVLCPSWAN